MKALIARLLRRVADWLSPRPVLPESELLSVDEMLAGLDRVTIGSLLRLRLETHKQETNQPKEETER